MRYACLLLFGTSLLFGCGGSSSGDDDQTDGGSVDSGVLEVGAKDSALDVPDDADVFGDDASEKDTSADAPFTDSAADTRVAETSDVGADVTDAADVRDAPSDTADVRDAPSDTPADAPALGCVGGCASGMTCAYAIADACSAAPTCVTIPLGSPCGAIVLMSGCSCRAGTVTWKGGCHPDLPPGYAPAPIVHTGGCP